MACWIHESSTGSIVQPSRKGRHALPSLLFCFSGISLMHIDLYVCRLATKHFYYAPAAKRHPIRLGKGDRENNGNYTC